MSFNNKVKRSDSKKNANYVSDLEKKSLNSKIDKDSYEKGRIVPPSLDKKDDKADIKVKVLRRTASAIPCFEIYPNYTLVTRQSQPLSMKMGTTTRIKSFQDRNDKYQPVSLLKPQYMYNGTSTVSAGTPPTISRTTSMPAHNRNVSTAFKKQMKPNTSVHNTASHKLQMSTRPEVKIQKRPISASTKPYYSNSTIVRNYESLNRTRNKSSANAINVKESLFYSLPRKLKKENHGKVYSSTTRILPSPLFIHTETSQKSKTSLNKLSKDSNTYITQNSSHDDPINFSETLAMAATNSPQIKRRSSCLLLSPNTRMNTRFATQNTIDEIYTQKNKKDNIEKFKKVASEILRENLLLKFGENYLLLNLSHDEHIYSSTSSMSSSLSGTDQQHSISSIPPDDIPLDIPGTNQNDLIPSNSNESFYKHNSAIPFKNIIETEDTTDIFESTLTRDVNNLKIVNNVHLSGEDSDDSNEYDLENEKSSSESFASESDGDIEQFKRKFVPLDEIERMDSDFILEDAKVQLHNYQHSQSFRIEDNSFGSMVEVFFKQESLQRAKDALMTEPNKSILSKNTYAASNKKRRAIFDPHILLLDICLEPDFNMVVELLPKISNISQSTVDGITALHNAVCSAESRLVLYLIQNGANVNASDADGWTPLHCSACCNNRHISRILVENGASLFALTLSDYEIPSQKCNKANQDDTRCEEYLIYEQVNLGVANDGIVYSLFDYTPQNSDELSLYPNKMLKVIDTSPAGETDWFFVEDPSDTVNFPKRRGMVAAAYVSCYPLILIKPNS